jgi:hypothetical protein
MYSRGDMRYKLLVMVLLPFSTVNSHKNNESPIFTSNCHWIRRILHSLTFLFPYGNSPSFTQESKEEHIAHHAHGTLHVCHTIKKEHTRN